ncbi:MAG: rane protein, partial [Abditibacteriota bacterium]|nr:rane protein [Abditibacteriota bacterium]
MNAAAAAPSPAAAKSKARAAERPKLNGKAILELLKDTWTEWNEDKAPRLGAAFAYYTVFSLSPLLIVLIAIAGAFFGDEAARGQIQREISGTIGPDAAKATEDMINGAAQSKNTGLFASIAGIATLLLSSSALFGQLQDALNTIWEVAPKPGQGFMAVVRQRFLSFSMVLGTGFLMLVSLAVSAAVSALGTFMGDVLPIPEFLLHIINFVIGFAVTTLLFAMIYKVLPDAEVQWHDVWIGAILTSLLFGIGRFALGVYLGKSGVSSTYGAAGSLVLILLW